MANTPTEYCILYRKTNQGNTLTGAGTGSGYVWLGRGDFSVSGNTNVPMGRITRIVFRHTHTSTRKPTWNLYGRLYFDDGSFVDSNVIGHGFSSDIYTYWNTFQDNLPTPEKYATWSSIRIMPASTPSSGQLYWRADRTDPMEIYVYFWSAADLVDGAEPPEVDGIELRDTTDLNDRFGGFIQGRSKLSAAGLYALDPNYQYLTARHALEITDAYGVTRYSASQDGDVFDIGALDASGVMTWTYTVTDSAGNAVSAQGAFYVLPYAPPAVSGLTVERYTVELDDEGHESYPAADDGELVRFSFSTYVTPISGLNAWTLKLRWGEEGTDETGGSERTVASGSDGGTWTYEDDRTILTDAVSASSGWWFRLTLTDGIDSVFMTAYADEATAYFNVEENGVAVGMRSNGTDVDKQFEVADGYEARFHGGIRGVTNYSLKEVPTGGRWIDGKPLYRRTFHFAAGSPKLSYIDISDLSAEFIDVAMAAFHYTYGSYDVWNSVYYYSSADYMRVYMHFGTQLVLDYGTGCTNVEALVTLEYTKSTDVARTIWVASANAGAVILAEQSEGLMTTTYDAETGRVTVTRVADLPWTYDNGLIEIGGGTNA